MIKEYGMTCIAPTACKILGIRPPAQSAGVIMNEVVDDMGSHDKLAIIALDAFGVATWKRYSDLVPNFNLLADGNLLHIRSVLPAKTPVNFATMATGAPSDVHNIRDRSEPLKVETIFHVLSENSMKSAASARAISSVGILLSKFADYKCLADSNTDEELVKIAIEAIQEKQPNFILMQLLDVDDVGHKAGLFSDEFKKAVSGIDKHIGDLLPYLAAGGYGLIVTADHGAHQAGNKATHDASTEDDVIVPLAWRSNEYLRDIYDLN